MGVGLRGFSQGGRRSYRGNIDAAMLNATVAFNGHLAVGYLMSGKAPQRVGNTNPIALPTAANCGTPCKPWCAADHGRSCCNN